jgi:hypothetical protein
MYAANKYGVVESLLIDMISIEFAATLFKMGHRLSMTTLREAAKEFIAKNISKVKKTQGWKNLHNDPNSAEILLELKQFSSIR